MLQRMTGTLACGFALMLGILPRAAQADSTLMDALFTDHVVLQRDLGCIDLAFTQRANDRNI